MNETTTTEKVWSAVKMILALAVVAIACNGMLVKGRQGAELAKEMKTMYAATAQHTAEANEVIEFAFQKGR